MPWWKLPYESKDCYPVCFVRALEACGVTEKGQCGRWVEKMFHLTEMLGFQHKNSGGSSHWTETCEHVSSCRNISQIFSLCGHFGQFYTFLSLPEVTQSRKSISLDIPSPCVRCSRNNYEAKDFPNQHPWRPFSLRRPMGGPLDVCFFFVCPVRQLKGCNSRLLRM